MKIFNITISYSSTASTTKNKFLTRLTFYDVFIIPKFIAFSENQISSIFFSKMLPILKSESFLIPYNISHGYTFPLGVI